MGLAGRIYLEQHFSRSAVAEKLAGILEDMLKRSGRHASGTVEEP
jgi:hypothetical protein